MSKLPALMFYPADWRKDPSVQSLSYFDRGVWFEILCLMHESEQRGKLLLNGNPMPDEALSRLLGLDKQILTKTLTVLLDYGVASRNEEGALINRRMVRDENLRQIRTEAGKKGGNPNLVKQNSTKAATKIKNKDNQNSTPSSSSSSSSSNNNCSGGGNSPARARGQPPTAAIVLTEAEKRMSKEEFENHLKTEFAYLGDPPAVIAECVAWYQRQKKKPPNRLQVKQWLADEYEDFDLESSRQISEDDFIAKKYGGKKRNGA